MFLGHEISKDGLSPPPKKLNVIKNYPRPKTVKQLQRFLGLCNWFSKFIPNFSSVALPLYKLTRKNSKFLWNDVCQAAFDNLKRLLLNSEVLAFPRQDLQYRIQVDSSKNGIGYMLYQMLPLSEVPNKSERERVRVIRFGSKSLKKHQVSYGSTKLELLGLITSVFRLYHICDGLK